MKMNKYIAAVIFDEGQSTCFASSAKGTKVFPITHDFKQLPQFFTINAIHASVDANPSMEYHAEDIPRRADHNVICFRNLLLECDTIPIDEQLEIAERIKLPFSIATHSGGKSVHFIISLKEPCANIGEYRELITKVQSACISAGLPVDTSTKNPSRLSRTPEAVRDNGNTQHLLSLLGRVRMDEIEAFLREYYVPPSKPPDLPQVTCFAPSVSYLFKDNKKLLIGICEKERHKQIMMCASDMRKNCFPKEYAIELIKRGIQMTNEKFPRKIPMDEVERSVDYVYSK